MDPNLALTVIRLYAASLAETHGYGYDDAIGRLTVRELIGHVATLGKMQPLPMTPPGPQGPELPKDVEREQQKMWDMGGG